MISENKVDHGTDTVYSGQNHLLINFVKKLISQI